MVDGTIIYGETNSSDKYRSFSIEVNKQPFNPRDPKQANVKFDASGNPIGSIYDLGADGGYKDIKLLISKFYDGKYFTKSSFEDHVGKALDEKGFDWYCTVDENEFLRKLPDYDVAWVISATTRVSGILKMKNSSFPEKLEAFHKARKGLMRWEDNDAEPWQHTTATLQKLFNMTVHGKYPRKKRNGSSS